MLTSFRYVQNVQVYVSLVGRVFFLRGKRLKNVEILRFLNYDDDMTWRGTILRFNLNTRVSKFLQDFLSKWNFKWTGWKKFFIKYKNLPSVLHIASRHGILSTQPSIKTKIGNFEIKIWKNFGENCIFCPKFVARFEFIFDENSKKFLKKTAESRLRPLTHSDRLKFKTVSGSNQTFSKLFKNIFKLVQSTKFERTLALVEKN